MKAKIVSILLCLAALASLAACGGDAVESASQPGNDPTGSVEASDPAGTQTSGTPAFRTDIFSFVINGTEITVDENMADVLNALGEPKSYFEAESCAFDGLDKTYTYAGFIITTRPDGDQDFINSIRLTDDSATTREGAYIGCTAEQVNAIYGDPENDLESAFFYTKGDSMLSFILEDGVVVSIEYLPAG